MAKFRPHIRVITKETQRDYYENKRGSAFASVEYKTYAELKKNLKKHLAENLEPTVSVYRSRRGQWGEWFEHWTCATKPFIIAEGWC